MRITLITFGFILFYIICVYFVESVKYKNQQKFLILALTMFAFFIGLRNGWPDQGVYEIAFEQAPLPWKIDFSESPYGYAEHGYYFLASVIKLIYNNSTFYFVVIASISMFLLYENLDKYCALPLLGLCDYIGRFYLNRDGAQIRSSLAILLIILAVKFIHERRMWPYMLVILLAYQFHHMALIGVPIYFLYKIPVSRNSIVLWLLVAIILSQLLAGTVESTVDAYSQDLNYETYTQDEYVEEALGLRNPMIWFQVFILLFYTYMEPVLATKNKYYYLFRWCYFYSTLILIFFCNYTALSGRTSTMFATCEMFILPNIALGLKGKNRTLFYVGMGLVLTYFFWSKYSSVMSMISST